MVMKEAKAESKLGVEIETLWKALAKDLRFIIPQLMPGTVEKIELLHGDGGVGSILLFHLVHKEEAMRSQKERIVEVDETKHELVIEVLEGNVLKRGFSSFETTFKLSSLSEKESLVDIKVAYETEKDGEDEQARMDAIATAPPLYFLQLLENFLLPTSNT
ncbi:phytohormone-binding protein-like [Cucurbita moschata]|uniref:Phytohormone-binding protein-like n=1 Tax=Cucurbita moschata TaxID=3662 RepID=A0A6J1EN52_CUCMO|nr:phytohormone-binding protein-like [Cucurbita moschata]